MILSSSKRVDSAVGWVKRGRGREEGASCERDLNVAFELVDGEYVKISFVTTVA